MLKNPALPYRSAGRQAIAALLADGSLALLMSVEGDLWEETAEEEAAGLANGHADQDGEEGLLLLPIPVSGFQLPPGCDDARYTPPDAGCAWLLFINLITCHLQEPYVGLRVTASSCRCIKRVRQRGCRGPAA